MRLPNYGHKKSGHFSDRPEQYEGSKNIWGMQIFLLIVGEIAEKIGEIKNYELRTHFATEHHRNRGRDARVPNITTQEHRTQNTEHRAQSTEHGAQSTEHRTQNTEHRAQSTEHGAQNTEHRAQNTEHRAQNTEHRTQNAEQKMQLGVGKKAFF